MRLDLPRSTSSQAPVLLAQASGPLSLFSYPPTAVLYNEKQPSFDGNVASAIPILLC